MKREWVSGAPIVVGTLLLCLANSAFSGVTGKIRGKVRDASTGEPLPGANVIIRKVWLNGQEVDYPGPTLGAASDAEGEFIILKVPPGMYSVTASMIGYGDMTHERVQVSVDRTTVLDFVLRAMVIDLGRTVTVEAARDLVQLDVSATENFITEEDYQNTPFANRVEDVLALQSGISGNIVEGSIKIREGKTREVGFLLDGMEMVDQKFNRPVITVQPGIVQEIKIMRNGFNAEYGQSRSGVINIVTKNPSERFHLDLDYQFTPAHRPHYGRNKYDPNWNLWRLYAGPKAFEGDTLITPDGRYETVRIWEGWRKYAQRLLNDSNPDNDLTAEEAFELWKWRHRPLKYGDKHGHNLDLSLSGPVPFLPWRTSFLLGGKYEYHPFNYPQSRDHYDERISSLKLVNILNPDTRLVLNSLYSEARSVTRNEPSAPWNRENRLSYDGGKFPAYYPYYKPVMDRYTSLVGLKLVRTFSPVLFLEANLSHFYVKWHMTRPDSARAEDGRYFHGRLYYDPQSGWIPKEKGADDNVSGYRMYGGGLAWDNSWNRRWALDAAMTYQFHSAHELKAGMNINYDIIREDRLYWDREDSTLAYVRDYKVPPIEIGVYLQDKIEFQGMIANVGVRIDYFNTNCSRPDFRRALEFATNRDIHDAYLRGDYPTFRARAKYYVSPRIGISHPISDKSKVYFNYGHFVQTPPSFQLYVTTVDGAGPSILQMGNADLPLEKTIAYELGFDTNVKDLFQLHLGAFYKDYFDGARSMTYAHSDQSLVMDWYSGYDYGEIRGIEIEVRRSFGHFISGWINYNYVKKSEANLTIPKLSENPIITDDPNIGINGVVYGVPPSDVIHIRPNARGVVTFSAPPGWGPKLRGYSVLGNTNLSLQVFYEGGQEVQHPRQSFRDAHPDVWFKELDRYWANMRLSRAVRIKGMDFEFYLDVSNIFHTKFRYPPSGRSGEDYFDDLWQSGRLNHLGTDKLTDPRILRTENDDVWWAKVKTYIFGLRINL